MKPEPFGRHAVNGVPGMLFGVVDNVVFPTAIDDRIDVYYGMADARIGAARLGIPAE